ncbi:MAG TPA: lysozyme inhibitor LprI family protein [Bordetella sp.]|nr:lysozyme inhibitor LprI family protein [Bordetella sp.]
MRIFVVTLGLALSAHGAQAQSAQPDCANAQDQATMSACAAADYKQADAVLNATYKQAAARLKDDTDQHQRLVAAQRAWIAFRDAECAFAAGSSEGGSAYPMLLAQCRATLTTQRTAGLQAHMKCEEGSLDCPIPAD